MESLRRQKRLLNRILSKSVEAREEAEKIKNMTPEEILESSPQGILLMASEQYQNGEVDLKKLCSGFNLCSVVGSGKIETSGAMYRMYDVVCSDYENCNEFLRKYFK